MGPFRLKQYVPGERITLERNPYYWKVDQAKTQLPYLDEVTFLFSGSEDNQVLRFQAGESDVINRLGPRNFEALEKSRKRAEFELVNAGLSLEYNFLFFNLAEIPKGATGGIGGALGGAAPHQIPPGRIGRHRSRFDCPHGVSGARGAVGRAGAAGEQVSGSTTACPRPCEVWNTRGNCSPRMASSWNREGGLLDAGGRKVEFSILTSNNNAERGQIAQMIQDDLKPLGIPVSVVPLEFRSLLDLVQRTHEYEACILSLASADADPNPDMAVWLSSGATHLWNPAQKTPATPWEAEIDTLMRRQMVTREYTERKRMFDRVQEMVVENLPWCRW